MSAKRQASYSIDPNTLEAKENDQEENPQTQNTQAPVSKQQRKIFKIKRPGQSDPSQQKQTKVAFKLSESQPITVASQNGKSTESKPEPQKPQETTNPFASLFKTDNKVFHGRGIFSNMKSTNLFTANKGSEQGSKAATSSNPFSSGPNIFASTTTTKGGNIFDTKPPSIFDNSPSSSIKNTSASLFAKSNQTLGHDDDGSGDSAQLQQAQNIQAKPQQSKAKYEYDDSCPVLLTLKVAKFKKSGGELIENLEIVLQKDKMTNIKYITVRLPATKKNIFSGVLVEGRSDIKHIHGKKQNVQVGAFYKEKDAFTKTYLKFQFENPQDGEKLYERLEELLAVSKQEGEEQKEKKE